MMPEIIHVSQDFSAAREDGVWGKGTAFESPCPAQHCRDLGQACAPLVFVRASCGWIPRKVRSEGIVDQPVENAVGNRGISDRKCCKAARGGLILCDDAT